MHPVTDAPGGPSTATPPARTMEYIYTNLGNGINHDLCLRFVGEMDFNLNKLKHEIEKMEKPT